MVSLAPPTRPLMDVLMTVTRGEIGSQVADAAALGLDPSVRRPLGELAVPLRTRLINQFVRGLRGVSVHDALRIERELLDRAGCAPERRCEIATRDGLSLIALRNHVRYLAVYAGMDWSEGMMLQSAFSELARLLQPLGGAKFGFRATEEFSEISVQVVAERPLSRPVQVQLDDWTRSLPQSLRCEIAGRDLLLLHVAPHATAA